MTLALALSGIGVGLLHASALPENHAENIKILGLCENALSSEIAVVYQNRKTLPEPSEMFLRLIIGEK